MREITISASLAVKKGASALPAIPMAASLDMKGYHVVHQTQTIPPEGAQINLGIIRGNPAKLLIANLGMCELGIYGDAAFTMRHDTLVPAPDFILRSRPDALWAKPLKNEDCPISVSGCEQ